MGNYVFIYSGVSIPINKNTNVEQERYVSDKIFQVILNIKLERTQPDIGKENDNK